MCGVVAMCGARDARSLLERALRELRHRGPDAEGLWFDDAHGVGLGHARLSIIDLTSAGAQPMHSHDERFVIAFNGELYNYVELRRELAAYPFRSQSDTEVALAAWAEWGPACLERFIGMFAFVIWDRTTNAMFAVRDRFGVKPLYYSVRPDGSVVVASEIKALHTAGVPRERDPDAWASFLAYGVTDCAPQTMWRRIEALPQGTYLVTTADGQHNIHRWYDFAASVGPEEDQRGIDVVREEYVELLKESIRLRFRSDVPVGINLSGGIDSSLLLGLVHAVQGPDSTVKAFTFTSGDEGYDELPWVRDMLERTQHPLVECRLTADEVPALAMQIARAQDEPFGGLPTLAYARIFERARADGVIVLLDGQGLDEQWAGYDYYRRTVGAHTPTVQGTRDATMRLECLSPELLARAESTTCPSVFGDELRNLQLRDTLQTKLPRSLRYNDRVSMAASTELREPFLDHRLFELAMRQPRDRKIRGDVGKWLLRDLARTLVPDTVRLAPKRPVQTPQREWLRGPLRSWANDLIEHALSSEPNWFDADAARTAWKRFIDGEGDNSYWVWQWLSLGLLCR